MNPQSSAPHSAETGFTAGANANATTVDATEIAKFTAMAEAWWDPQGDFKPLHRFNPTRIAYIRDVATAHFGRDITAELPFDGLSLLEVGCGGGLLTEPMRRLGAEVTGIDPAPRISGSEKKQQPSADLPANAPAAQGQQQGNHPMSVMASAMRQHLQEVRSKVEANCDYVGDKFADEARKIHYGETESRGIYGEATDHQHQELVEEGVEVARVPWLPRSDA